MLYDMTARLLKIHDLKKNPNPMTRLFKKGWQIFKKHIHWATEMLFF